MPNFDAGHYFLTALAPVRLDSILIDGQSRSRRHLIREALADLPAGERTKAAQGKNPGSPFALNSKTHFARLFVLDDVVFNGRDSGDTLIGQLRHIDPLTPQPVDRLTNPFLVLVTDFDAESGGDYVLREHMEELWSTMQAELTNIFQHCVGFDAVKTGEDFFHYIKQCQIETTMPFNDYWSAPPGLSDLNFTPYKYGVIGLAVLAFLTLVSGKIIFFLLALIGLGVTAYLAYRAVTEKAAVPFPQSLPPAPSPDLQTVLKALFVQREFTEFAINAQSKNNQELYDDFGALLGRLQIDNLQEPTQLPGVIGVPEEDVTP